MIQWDRKKFRRNLTRQILTLLGLMFFFSLTYQFQQSYAGKTAPFLIEYRSIVPLKEISGLTVHPASKGRQISFITDRKADILSYLQPEGKSIRKSFGPMLLEKSQTCRDTEFRICDEERRKLTANWEGLALDGKGRFFALQEHTQQLLVLDPGLNHVEKILQFDFSESFDPLWRLRPEKLSQNSLAEGLLLLNNGHFLLAKEKDPMLFVEFGPDGDTPLGVHPDTVLGKQETFEIPTSSDLRVRYKALASWPISANGKCDISDLAVDDKGQLLALSETCLQITRYGELPVGGKAEAQQYLPLPPEIRRPEALAVEGDAWYIASDLSSKRQYNFYILRPLNSVK